MFLRAALRVQRVALPVVLPVVRRLHTRSVLRAATPVDVEAVVLRKIDDLAVEKITVYDMDMGPNDVRIAVKRVGICMSDVHYYKDGKIGDFVLNGPMILGHESAGIVVDKGSDVTDLEVGQMVCMEPGVPDMNSRETLIGAYNLSKDLRFWATPPKSPKLLGAQPGEPLPTGMSLNTVPHRAGHGCLRHEVVHPAAFTHKLLPGMNYDQGALVEPLAVGMHAATKANIKPGDVGLVFGAGPIGVLQAVAALASGCSKVIISDISQQKLDVAASLAPEGKIVPVLADENVVANIKSHTVNNWGPEVIFECSGAQQAITNIAKVAAPLATAVFVGCPHHGGDATVNIPELQVVEVTCKPIFRYANVYPKAIDLIASAQIDLGPENLKKLITSRYPFAESKAAFDHVARNDPTSIKIMIELSD